MTDTAPDGGGTVRGFARAGLNDIGALFRRGDLALATGVMTILVVLILPLPAMLLDLRWRFRSSSRC
jgi:flagellar biosynthesis protein FlhA